MLTAGRNVFYYNTAYEPQEDEVILVKDEDGDSTNGITMDVPANVLALSYDRIKYRYSGSRVHYILQIIILDLQTETLVLIIKQEKLTSMFLKTHVI